MTALANSILRQISSLGYQVGVERDYFSVTYTATDLRTGQRFEVIASGEQETDAALRLAEHVGLPVSSINDPGIVSRPDPLAQPEASPCV